MDMEQGVVPGLLRFGSGADAAAHHRGVEDPLRFRRLGQLHRWRPQPSSLCDKPGTASGVQQQGVTGYHIYRAPMVGIEHESRFVEKNYGV